MNVITKDEIVEKLHDVWYDIGVEVLEDDGYLYGNDVARISVENLYKYDINATLAFINLSEGEKEEVKRKAFDYSKRYSW